MEGEEPPEKVSEWGDEQLLAALARVMRMSPDKRASLLRRLEELDEQAKGAFALFGPGAVVLPPLEDNEPETEGDKNEG